MESRRPASTAGLRCAVLLCVAALAWGCSPAVTGPPTAAPPAGPTASTPSAAPKSSPSPTLADTLRVGWGPGQISGFRYALEGACCQGSAPKKINLETLVYGGLYRYDATFNAIPDLSDGPCQPQADPKVIRCRIIETTFHDGTPLTADDVAYTYQLLSRPTFSGGPGLGSWIPSLKEVRVVGPRTVEFVLTAVDPTFLTTVLSSVPILPRHVVETNYAAFVAATKALKVADLTKLADSIDEETAQDPPVCTTHLDEAAAVFAKLGVPWYREDFAPGGTFDPCPFVKAVSGSIRYALLVSLDSTGLDAVAAAYIFLQIDWHPIGAGPYRFVSEDAIRIHLEAWPGYHGGLAATRNLDFVPTKGDGSELVNGTVDIYQAGSFTSDSKLGSVYQATAASHGVLIATPPQTAYVFLAFNVRPGHLFRDVALRRALQLCVDLPRDVDAATGGAGTAIYGPVLPGSWADDPALPKPARDTNAARKLIEGAGWTLGADGIYARNGVRLGTSILVRGDRKERVKMADLIASQAGDCGMDLRSQPMGWDMISGTFYSYPHDIPGTKTPFDLYIGAWTTEADPGKDTVLASSTITDAKHPDRNNFSGFSDPVLDRLDAAAMATYDQAARANLYRQEQEEIAAQLPYLFLWANNAYDIVRTAVTNAGGLLDLTAPYWDWQPERLVVEKSSP